MNIDFVLAPQSSAVPHAEPGPVTRPFWDGCRRSELLHQRCGRCRAVNFPPTAFCRACQAPEPAWEAGGGRGRLYSWTVVHRPVTPAFTPPYAAAIVTLDEGHQIVTNIVNATPRQLRVDLPVRVTFVEVGDGLVLPYFEPAIDIERAKP